MQTLVNIFRYLIEFMTGWLPHRHCEYHQPRLQYLPRLFLRLDLLYRATQNNFAVFCKPIEGVNKYSEMKKECVPNLIY